MTVPERDLKGTVFLWGTRASGVARFRGELLKRSSPKKKRVPTNDFYKLSTKAQMLLISVSGSRHQSMLQMRLMRQPRDSRYF